MDKNKLKLKFDQLLKNFAYELNLDNLNNTFSRFQSGLDNPAWAVRGIVDIHQNIYPISSDTKLISKVLESQLFPFFSCFAYENDLRLELASHQNYYPDMTFIANRNERVKFAVDLKTTYRNPNRPEFCNGFTLGSYMGYFRNRNSGKNIMYPYDQYIGHFCFCVVYSRYTRNSETEKTIYSVRNVNAIPPAIGDFVFFAHEKWRIASKTTGSGNTANIGSIKNIEDLYYGKNGAFSSEEEFDEYWMNYARTSEE